METVRELLIALGLDVDQAKFVEAIGLEHLLEKGAELAVDAFKELISAMGEAVTETAHYSDEVKDATERTGLAAAEVQSFAYVAGIAGLTFADVEVSLNHLARAMQSAKEGGKEASSAFAKLGVRVTDGNGQLRSLDDIMGDVADGLQRVPKGAARAAAAFDIFGRSGGKMLNVLGEGKAAFQELAAEAFDFGTVLDDEAIARGDELSKNFKRLGMIMDALKREFAQPLIEALGPLVDEALAWLKANRELIGSRLREWARGVVVVAKFLLDVFTKIGKVLGFVIEHFKALVLILGGVLLAVIIANIGALSALVVAFASAAASAVIAGLAAAGAWLAAVAPVVLLAAILAALLLAAEDVYGFLTGADSAIGELGPKWTKFLDTFLKEKSDDHWLVATFKQLGRLLTDFSGAWDQFVKDWQYALNQIWLGLPAPLRKLLSGGAEAISLGGGAASVGVAAGSAAAASSSSSVSGDINAPITINAPEGASPEAIANATVDRLEEFHARKNREALGSLGVR